MELTGVIGGLRRRLAAVLNMILPHQCASHRLPKQPVSAPVAGSRQSLHPLRALWAFWAYHDPLCAARWVAPPGLAAIAVASPAGARATCSFQTWGRLSFHLPAQPWRGSSPRLPETIRWSFRCLQRHRYFRRCWLIRLPSLHAPVRCDGPGIFAPHGLIHIARREAGGLSRRQRLRNAGACRAAGGIQAQRQEGWSS